MSGVLNNLVATGTSGGGGGGGGNYVELTDLSVYALAFSPTAARAGIRFGSDGILYSRVNLGSYVAVSGQWLHTPSGTDADAYEVRATLSSGVAPSGTRDTWLPLTSTYDWTLIRSSNGANACTLLLEVRDVASSTVQASATFYLTAEQQLGGGEVSA